MNLTLQFIIYMHAGPNYGNNRIHKLQILIAARKRANLRQQLIHERRFQPSGLSIEANMEDPSMIQQWLSN